MDKQAKEARKMAKDLPVGKKISHIWEYYKYWILGGLFAVLVIGGTVYSVVTKPTYDLTVAYYSEEPVSPEKTEELEAYLASLIEDYDGNGETTVRVNVVSASTLGETADIEYAVQQKFVAELAAGSAPIFLVNGVYHETVTDESFSDTMESVREITADTDFGALLGDKTENPVYWCTRVVYGTEQKKEERIQEHDHAAALEVAVLGERE